MTSDILHIVLGIIANSEGSILIAKRSTDTPQGGLWEFPGGKVEHDEDPKSALIRELREELGIEVMYARPLIKFPYNYPEQKILFDVWKIYKWYGEANGREGQLIDWVPVSSLSKKKFPAANKNIITSIQLPSLYLIIPDLSGKIDDYIMRIEACLESGVRLLQLRCGEKLIRDSSFVACVLDLCNSYNAELLLNSEPENAVKYNAHGVHLSSARLLQMSHRPLDSSYWVAASCHDQKELIHACHLGVDFIVCSPVKRTTSHPEAKPLGWKKFLRFAEIATVPIYALGGMYPRHLSIAWEYGAQGVALLSSVWQANDPAEIIRDCIKGNPVNVI